MPKDPNDIYTLNYNKNPHVTVKCIAKEGKCIITLDNNVFTSRIEDTLKMGEITTILQGDKTWVFHEVIERFMKTIQEDISQQITTQANEIVNILSKDVKGASNILQETVDDEVDNLKQILADIVNGKIILEEEYGYPIYETTGRKVFTRLDI
jgi:hypothetical protein